jgi:predicted DNA-binding transcriptional regulator AlpA
LAFETGTDSGFHFRPENPIASFVELVLRANESNPFGESNFMSALQVYSGDQASQPTLSDATSRAPLLKLGDLFKALAVSKSTGHRLIASGKIGPRAIHLTGAIVRFDADEVDGWLTHRKQDGSLHDARTWPAMWDSLKRKR